MRRGPALATLFGVLFLTFLDTTIVTVALGDIHYDFGSGVIPLQWVVSAYSLVFASSMLTAGSLSDRFGRKRLLLAGLVAFCAGSVLAAVAPEVGTLIGGRALMGLGAAAAEPGTLSILRQLYPDRAERARALGGWAAVSGLALALGPVIGGLLVGAGGWRAVFWFNLAVGVVLLALAAALVPESADRPDGPPDIAGFALGALALAGLTYAVIAGEQHGYGAWWIVTAFAVAGAAAAGLAVTERRARNPVLDLRILGRRAVSGPLFVGFTVYFGIFAIFFFTALYLDLVVGYSPWQLSGVFAPMASAIVMGSSVAGRWVARAGVRGPMTVGCLLSAAGILAARQVIGPDPSFGRLALALAVAGAGFGLAVVPLTAAVLQHVPATRSGMAASATNTARQVGAVIGVAALGALVNAHLTGDFSKSLSRTGVGDSGRNFIIDLLETGGSGARRIDIAHPSPVVKSLVDAGTAAFENGVRAALLVAALAIVVAAAVAALGPRGLDRSETPAAGPVAPAQ